MSVIKRHSVAHEPQGSCPASLQHKIRDLVDRDDDFLAHIPVGPSVLANPVHVADEICVAVSDEVDAIDPADVSARHFSYGLPDQVGRPFPQAEYSAGYLSLANHKTNTAHGAIAYLTSAATPLAATSTAAFHPEVAS